MQESQSLKKYLSFQNPALLPRAFSVSLETGNHEKQCYITGSSGMIPHHVKKGFYDERSQISFPSDQKRK